MGTGFFQKSTLRAEAIADGWDRGIVLGDIHISNRPLSIEGELVATTLIAGSVNLDILRVGSGSPISNVWAVTYTWNIPAIVPGTGSTNAIVSQDAAMSGAAVGNPVLISPIGSMAFGLLIWGACYSAGVVNLRADYGGTTGAYTPGNVPIRITCIKV